MPAMPLAKPGNGGNAAIRCATARAAGHGDTPLLELPLRCIDCGKRGHGIIVRCARQGRGDGPNGWKAFGR
jgi:hypothetical protein